jgi:hypothetical protein
LPDKDKSQVLLDRASSARAEAERLLRQASGMPQGDIRSTLIGLASILQARAADLEQRAFNTAPPPTQRHENPQQMQQARITSPKSEDDPTSN